MVVVASSDDGWMKGEKGGRPSAQLCVRGKPVWQV